jgi:hypothetical protein
MRLIQSKRRDYHESIATNRKSNFDMQNINYSQVQSGEGVLATLLSGIALGKTAYAGFKKVNEFQKGETGTKISNFVNSNINKNPAAQPGFSGETHMYLPTKYGYTRGNFVGPGTRLSARLNRNDIGVDGPNGIDSAARTHDIAYNQAKTVSDIRQADDVFINSVENSSQSPNVKKLVATAIKMKKIGEDVGLTDVNTFTDVNQVSGSGKCKKHKHPASRLKSKVLKGLLKKPKSTNISMMITEEVLKSLQKETK